MKRSDIHNYYLDKFKDIYSNKYDYSESVIVKSNIKIIVICNNHGRFLVTPNNHLSRKSGCPKCKNIDIDFIELCKTKHNNYYDYSLVEYKNNRSKIKIICPKHGIFEQIAMNHKTGSICKKCSDDNRRTNIQNLIKIGGNIFSNKYDYSLIKIDYKNMRSIIRIICPNHGEFKQEAASHFIKGYGCRICRESSGEREISKILDEKNIKYEREKKFNECRNKQILSFDFYLSDYNICIEYNGTQHYIPNIFFGGKNQFIKQIENDSIKDKYCSDNNIELYIIKYDSDIKEELEKILNK